MIEWVIAGVVSLGAGIAASMGFGGGFILLVYLTAVAGMDQIAAQWINLLFFLPVGGVSLFLHWKNHLIEKKAVLPALIGGVGGSIGGVLLAQWIGGEWLSRLFATFLAILSVRELLRK
ncbi:MAG: TSUP family transporter [Candidatus Merdivicinus sp.]|jgi:uncharacterized membrane protein YfcA